MINKSLKYTLTFIALASIFIACNSNGDNETRTEMTTDSTSYKTDMATSAIQEAIDSNAVRAANSNQKVADGSGAVGGYAAGEKDKKVADGPGAGGGYIAGEKKFNKVADGPGLGGGYIAGQKDKKITDGPGNGGGYIAGEKDKKNLKK